MVTISAHLLLFLLVSHIYPPKNVAGLRLLFTTIEEKDELDRLKKSSFVYYLLKDFDRADSGGEFASHYAQKALIQPNFCNLMDGLYAMDNFDFEVRFTCSLKLLAMSSLTDIRSRKPSIT